jgi:hypothetical protein
MLEKTIGDRPSNIPHRPAEHDDCVEEGWQSSETDSVTGECKS